MIAARTTARVYRAPRGFRHSNSGNRAVVDSVAAARPIGCEQATFHTFHPIQDR